MCCYKFRGWSGCTEREQWGKDWDIQEGEHGLGQWPLELKEETESLQETLIGFI